MGTLLIQATMVVIYHVFQGLGLIAIFKNKNNKKCWQGREEKVYLYSISENVN